MMTQDSQPYYCDYETEPIGEGNPYYRCIHCKRSDPEINGQISKHLPDCLYRLDKESLMGSHAH